MSLRLGYLTPKQRLGWRLKSEGLTEAGIGRKLKIMRARKQLALIALLVILVVSNITFAYLYMTKVVEVKFGVSKMGTIEVYGDDGVTPLTNIEFANFTDPTGDFRFAYFFINNTGSLPIYVYWNLTSTDDWVFTDGVAPDYAHWEDGKTKFVFYIVNATSPFAPWHPDTEGLFLDVNEGQKFRCRLDHSGLVNTPELASLRMNFYARDA